MFPQGRPATSGAGWSDCAKEVSAGKGRHRLLYWSSGALISICCQFWGRRKWAPCRPRRQRVKRVLACAAGVEREEHQGRRGAVLRSAPQRHHRPQQRARELPHAQGDIVRAAHVCTDIWPGGKAPRWGHRLRRTSVMVSLLCTGENLTTATASASLCRASSGAPRSGSTWRRCSMARQQAPMQMRALAASTRRRAARTGPGPMNVRNPELPCRTFVVQDSLRGQP